MGILEEKYYFGLERCGSNLKRDINLIIGSTGLLSVLLSCAVPERQLPRRFIEIDMLCCFVFGIDRGVPQFLKESESEVAQSCLTLCDPMDCSPPGSSVPGILQASILEWVAFPFSRGSSRPRDRTRVSRIAGRGFLTSEPPGKPLSS